jgi:hypothetical protein
MKIHGEWQISIIGDVMVRTTAGSFNERGTSAVFQETLEKIPQDRPWVSLGDARLWEMSNTASLQAISAMRDCLFQRGCVGLAIVLPGRIRSLIFQRETGSTPNERLQFFSTLEEACTWLSSLGFSITPADYPHTEFVTQFLAKQSHDALPFSIII